MSLYDIRVNIKWQPSIGHM